MDRVTVVHVGLMKTGTTTLQRMLFDARQSLRRAGILYPAGREFNHTLAVTDALRCDPLALARIPDGLHRYMEENRAEIAGRFDELSQVFKDAHHHVRRIISAENLIHASPLTISRLSNDWRIGNLIVLVTVRSPSNLVRSYYQQFGQQAVVPSFETWARQRVSQLALGDPTGELWSLRLDRFVSQWEPYASEMHLVDMDSDGYSVGLRNAWRIAVGEEIAPPVAGRLNPGLSAAALDALQAFLRRSPRTPDHTANVLVTVARSATNLFDYNQGGRYELTEEFSEILNRALAGQASRGGVLLDLARRLECSEPITSRFASRSVMPPQQYERSVREIYRSLRKADARLMHQRLRNKLRKQAGRNRLRRLT